MHLLGCFSQRFGRASFIDDPPKLGDLCARRLAYMGSRAMGALEYKHKRSPPKHKPSAIVLPDLVT